MFAKGNPQASASENIGSAPSLSLPKGGGAVRSIGEKFSVSASKGTASLSIPIFASPGRSGFTPGLGIAYDSGAGMGSFGMGWSLSVPSISRKTERKLPQYRDSFDGSDSDVFLLSGAEDLVPVRKDVSRQTLPGEGSYLVVRYRPRIEGLFSRIEKWVSETSGEIHWRVRSRDNSLSVYGKSMQSCIADPEDPKRIFQWLLEESRDDKGNIARYEYKRENADGVDASKIEEASRLSSGFANLYLKRVLYGNRKPFEAKDWLFELVFDYGDHHPDRPEPIEDRKWLCRKDPFSFFKAGFEVRTYRLCRRALMFHRFEELGPKPCLVRSSEFEYREDEVFSFLSGVQSTSWRRKSGAADYVRKSMPKVEFAYTKAQVDPTVRSLDPESSVNLPQGVDESRYRWEDLEQEGIAGVLTESSGAWFYKRNLGAAKLGPLERVAEKPSANLGSGAVLTDVAGNSGQYLVQKSNVLQGFWRKGIQAHWEAYTPFENVAASTDRLEEKLLLDLDGDGLPEILLDEESVYSWYPSLGEKGYGPKRCAAKSPDATRRPALLRAGKSESVFAADMSGDGLQDIVRVRNGEISYWPNLGWGRFGSRIAMSDSPQFDHPDQFDPQRIRLADIDGSGISDIFYLGRKEIRYWLNRSGNGWSAPGVLETFPKADDSTTISVVDLLGHGTSCLVWSSSLPGDAGRPFRYIDLMGGGKPHLLCEVKNNLGAETKVSYASSTQFYLADRAAGRPWITQLPFPIQLVLRTEAIDRIGGNRFITRYAYHHGYYDREEREFRGFGLVETWDTEEFSVWMDESEQAANVDSVSHVPPVLTRTWYHMGAYFSGETISRHFSGEYFAGDPGISLLPDTVLPSGLSAEEEREACRALKNGVLRQEIYGLDGSDKAGRPYSVSERNYTVRCLQPRGENSHAVFHTHSRETLDSYYERTLYSVGGQPRFDPRVSHAMVLDVDDYGNTLLQTGIAYGRRHDDPDPVLDASDRLEQKKIRITVTETRYTNPVMEEAAYRTPLPCEGRTYEVLNLIPQAKKANVTNLFTMEEMRAHLAIARDGAHEIPYEDVQASLAKPGAPAVRRIEESRTLYRSNDLAQALALGRLESLALPFESYKLAFTPGLIEKSFEGRVTEEILAQGRYIRFPGDARWWAPAGRVFYSPIVTHSPAEELAFARKHFFLNFRFQDPFGNNTKTVYDAYDLVVLETEDALQNKTTLGERLAGKIESRIDYRMLLPTLMTDANGNRSQVALDTWGFVTGIAMMGKLGEKRGDSLEGFEPDLDEKSLAAVLADPLTQAPAFLGKASTRLFYDVFAYARSASQDEPQPSLACTVTRQTHDSILTAGQTSPLYCTISYSDGFGREIQTKAQSEDGPIEPGSSALSKRWVTSGWQIFNNKGLAIKKFEPFFSPTHRFESGSARGVSATLFYDPMGRTVATLLPNHAYDKVFFDPWRQERWDSHDTILSDPSSDPHVGEHFRRIPEKEYSPSWHAARIGGALGPEEQMAAQKAAAHADTPTRTYSDSLGRVFLTVADNGSLGKERTKIVLDIEGNQLAVIDALGRVVQRSAYDILGGQLFQESMESGKRWVFSSIADRPLYSWDDRGQLLRAQYDALQRPLSTILRDGSVGEKLIYRAVYGEAKGDLDNHRGRVWEVFDGAGKVTNEAYDFKGNLLRSSRRFALDYRNQLDWAKDVALEEKAFVEATAYDAFNRPCEMIASDGSVLLPHYDRTRILDRVEARVRGSKETSEFVSGISYNSKGQRTEIRYGNGVKTSYEYDSLTFRLMRLRSVRAAAVLQDLRYTYDPAGNLTSLLDLSQPTIYFAGAVVEAHCEYSYDALHRLLFASGREHIGQQQEPETSWSDAFRSRLAHPHDGQAMRRYGEHYRYDAAGNLLELVHQTQNQKWKRQYHYDEASPLEAGKKNNRLSRTTIGRGDAPGLVQSFSYDAHGNMAQMPHLSAMRWDYKNQLRSVSSQSVTPGTPSETTYYVYDANGKRVRKVTDRSNGTRKAERRYMGSVELYQEFDGAGVQPALERETLQIMDSARRIALVETKTRDLAAPQNLPQTLTRFQMENHLGSSALELDEKGAVISYEEYFPYGGSSYQAGRSSVEVSLKRYRYSGKERDEETGFYYYGVRYYAPWLARWTQCDPGGLVDGHNLYQFVQCNPIRLRDLTGFQCNEINVCPPPPPPILQKEVGVGEDGFPIIEVSNTVIIGDGPRRPEPRFEGGFRTDSLWDLPAYWALYRINVSPGKSANIALSDANLKMGQDFCVGTAIVALTIATAGMAAEVGAAAGWGVVTVDAFAGGVGSSTFLGATSLYEGKDPSPEEAVTTIATGAVGGVAIGAVARALPGVVGRVWNSFRGEGSAVTSEAAPATQNAAKAAYKTKPMLGKYVTENLPGNKVWPGRQVQYLGESERQSFKITIKDGKMYDATGKLFDTSSASTAHQGGGGKAIFVMDEAGNIFASMEHSVAKFHHSSFLGGKPVAAAGEIQVENGVVKAVTDQSGHYQPGFEYTMQFLNQLGSQGVNTSGVNLTGMIARPALVK